MENKLPKTQKANRVSILLLVGAVFAFIGLSCLNVAILRGMVLSSSRFPFSNLVYVFLLSYVSLRAVEWFGLRQFKGLR
jgi:RsiW-degrading membrane proteinase PrsW (M82 family)